MSSRYVIHSFVQFYFLSSIKGLQLAFCCKTARCIVVQLSSPVKQAGLFTNWHVFILCLVSLPDLLVLPVKEIVHNVFSWRWKVYFSFAPDSDVCSANSLVALAPYLAYRHESGNDLLMRQRRESPESWSGSS